MKKIIIFIAILGLLLTGCSKNNNLNIDEERTQLYNSYIQAISDNESFSTEASNYNIALAINKINDQQYRFDVILDQPLVSMKKVQIMAIEKDVIGNLLTENMVPTAGILEDQVYNLLPNQVDSEKNYPAGISISGTSQNANETILVMVVWYGISDLVQNRDFYLLQGSYTGESND